MISDANAPNSRNTEVTPTWSAPLASDARTGTAAGELGRIERKVDAGERLTPDEGLFLHERVDLLSLGRLARRVRARKHPEPVVTYIVDRNVNPTNVCVTDCGFCAFYRRPGDPESYVLSREEIYDKVQETVDQGGRQLLMQGGHHPYLKSDWWCELFRDLSARFEINLHALSAPEIDHLAKLEKRPVAEVVRDLADAGLGSVPGAGAEMLVERVRRIIAPKKTTTDEWLAVHRTIHEAGLRSSATMMFGHFETPAERVEHLLRLRELQDETGGFTAFICWNVQPAGVPEAHMYPDKTTPATYLRVQALGRIFLDNFDNVQTSYVTQGMKMAQVSLGYGANDFGGTMIEENVVSAAGCAHLESIPIVERMIEAAGFIPRQRNSWYGIVDPRHTSETSPKNREEAGNPTRRAPVPPSERGGGGIVTELRERAERVGLGAIADKIFARERLSTEDGVALYRCPDVHVVGDLANHVRERLHGDLAYFNVNQHINYTNICNKLCRFCAFQRLPGQDGAYVFSPEQIADKIRGCLDQPVTEVHMVAGIYPRLPYSYYLDILRAAKAARPGIHVKAFTMVELQQIARRAKKPLEEVLPELVEAGLGSCPGGGAEVFSDRVHAEGYHLKNTGTEWIELARTVHRAGLRTNCTMLHGHIETIEERVDHLDRLRRLQDETGGFQTYIPLSFHPENSEWAHLPGPTAVDELREIAVGRLMLDNIPHVKAYWIMLSIPIAQLALSYGADDVDGTVVEERIYHDAGATTPQEVARDELIRWIRDAGRIPVERDTLYNVVWSADEERAAPGRAAPVAG